MNNSNLPNDNYVDSAINSIYDKLLSTSDGSRNTALFKEATNAYEFVYGGYISEAEVTSSLESIAKGLGLKSDEIKSSLRSARTQAVKNPRVIKDKQPQINIDNLIKKAQEDAKSKADNTYALNQLKELQNNSAEGHPYLVKKKLEQHHGAFFSGRDSNGQFIGHKLFSSDRSVVGYERIYSDKKMVSKGAGCKGVYFGAFKAPESGSTCYITEGAADALSIMESTLCDSFSATSAGNISKVADIMAEQYDHVIIALDNDSAGQKEAAKLSSKYKCVMPSQMNDYSDVFVSGGDMLAELNNPAKTPPTHTPTPPTQEKAISDPFGLCEIDITKPHGILGDMCKAMDAAAHRMLAEAYPLYGLQTLAMVAMVAGIRSFTGSKLNLITLLIAPTASGKENGQAFFDDVAAQLKLSKYTFNKPRSDKDLITNMVETEGMCSYSIDEAHGLFDSMQNKNAQSYQLAMGAEMLTMATKSNYVLSGNHRREFRLQYETRLARLEGALEKLEGDDREAQQKKRNFEEKIKHYERTLEAIENGFKHPLINMAMASTPEKIDKVVSSETIESGLMGRSLVIRADEDRAELNLYPSAALCSAQTIEALNNAMDRHGAVSISAEARELYEKVVIHYDRTMRNHSTLGGLYARIGDRATAIASLLAVTSGEVTENDMRYAFALCLRHIEDCRFLLVKADAVESGDYDGQLLEVKERILKFCSKMGTARGQLCQKVTKPKGIAKMMREAATSGKPSIYDDAINQLITDNMISMDGNRFIKL